jgi:deoxyribonuclease IV
MSVYRDSDALDRFGCVRSTFGMTLPYTRRLIQSRDNYDIRQIAGSATMAPMPPHRLRLGPHLPLGMGMLRAAERARAIGATAVQIFGDNPTAWKRRAEPPREQARFRERLATYDIRPVAIHAAYLVNLAGPERDFFERSIEVLTSDLRAAPGFGASYVNVHTGSHRDTGIEAGIARLADGVARTLGAVPADPSAACLVLENAAGGGFAVGSTVEELAAIADAIAARGVGADRVGFCLDTAHLWSAGYCIREPDDSDALLERFDALIGLERLRMMHLNDSKSESGFRLDRHEHIGAGQIGPRGLAHLLTHPRLAHVAWYLETPGMDEGYDAVNVRRAFDLAAGRPLAPLPPEAFNLRSRSKAAASAGPAA